MLTANDTVFIEALFAHSDPLDGQPEKQPPKDYGGNLFDYMLTLREFEKSQEQREGREVYLALRMSWISLLASYLRIVWQAKLRQRPLPQTHGGITPEEAAAAYLILNFAAEETQHEFLLGTREFQDSLIYAVLKDGGIYDHRKFWCELVLP